MSRLALEPAVRFELRELAEILTSSFEQYFVPISFTPASLATRIRIDGIDLGTSRVLTRDGSPVGCVLLAHRGWTTRVAAMGVTLGARGTGVGRFAMQRLIDEARERADRAIVLEVIEQNTGAIDLYRKSGFRDLRRLVGFRAERPSGVSTPGLVEVDTQEVTRVLSRVAPDDLPWQASAGSILQWGRPHMGFRLGAAYVAISDPSQPSISIRSLVVGDKTALRTGHGTRLLRALFALYSEKTWLVSAIWPEEIAPGFFASLGFQQESLSQLQMQLLLE